jgi:hypothetical protein
MIGVSADVKLTAHEICSWVTYCALFMYGEFRRQWKEDAVANLTLSKPNGKREVFCSSISKMAKCWITIVVFNGQLHFSKTVEKLLYIKWKRRVFMNLILFLWPPLWFSVQGFWPQIQSSGFDSRRFQIFWEVVGVERGPFSLVSTIEELLEKKSSGSGL